MSTETLTATIKMCQPKHDHLKVRNKRGTVKPFVWVVIFGPIHRVCPSEKSADKYLQRLGFVLSDDCTHYVHKYKSEEQINLERNYTIF